MYFIPYNYSLKIIGVFTLKKWINSLFIILFFIFKDFNKTDRIGIELIVNGGRMDHFYENRNSHFPFQFIVFLRVSSLFAILWINSLNGVNYLYLPSTQIVPKKSIFFKYCEIPFHLREIVYFNMLNLLFFFSPFFLRIW